MKLDEKTLAQYYDGELGEAETAAVKKLLDASPTDAELLRRMENLSEMFQLMAKENLESVSFDGFDKRVWNAIRLEKTPVPVMERLGVWTREFLAHRKRVWIPSVSFAGAACAVLLALGLFHSGPDRAPLMPAQNSPATWQASAPTSSLSSTVEVKNETDLAITKYNLRTENGQQIAVVWINE